MKKQHLITGREIFNHQTQSGDYADLVLHIERHDRVTACIDAAGMPRLEYTTPHSPIAPVVIVRGGFDGRDWTFTAEAGPGQAVSADTLRAYEIAACCRVQANTRARMAAAAYGADMAGHTQAAGQKVEAAI